jgi:hypothetical protein
MSILIELPEDLERALRQQMDNLDASAKEAFLVDLYREGKIGYGQLCRGLGIGRMEVEAILKRHKVYYEITVEDVVRESDEVRKLRESDADRR